jgi:hypothetical protein
MEIKKENWVLKPLYWSLNRITEEIEYTLQHQQPSYFGFGFCFFILTVYTLMFWVIIKLSGKPINLVSP